MSAPRFWAQTTTAWYIPLTLLEVPQGSISESSNVVLFGVYKKYPDQKHEYKTGEQQAHDVRRQVPLVPLPPRVEKQVEWRPRLKHVKRASFEKVLSGAILFGVLVCFLLEACILQRGAIRRKVFT